MSVVVAGATIVGANLKEFDEGVDNGHKGLMPVITPRLTGHNARRWSGIIPNWIRFLAHTAVQSKWDPSDRPRQAVAIHVDARSYFHRAMTLLDVGKF
eukprot:COSAG06_NODE_2833_length_6205_cov_3.583361_2_plen_98_part_00